MTCKTNVALLLNQTLETALRSIYAELAHLKGALYVLLWIDLHDTLLDKRSKIQKRKKSVLIEDRSSSARLTHYQSLFVPSRT